MAKKMPAHVETDLLYKLQNLNIPGIDLKSLEEMKDHSLNKLFMSMFLIYDSTWAQEQDVADKKQVKKNILRYLRLMDVAHLVPNINSLRPGNPAVIRSLGAVVGKLEDKYGGRVRKRCLQVFKTAPKRKLMPEVETAKENTEKLESHDNIPEKKLNLAVTPSRGADRLAKTPVSGKLKLLNGQPIAPGSELRGRELARSPPLHGDPLTPHIVSHRLESADHASPALRQRTPKRKAMASPRSVHKHQKNNSPRDLRRSANKNYSDKSASPKTAFNAIPTGNQLPRTPTSQIKYTTKIHPQELVVFSSCEEEMLYQENRQEKRAKSMVKTLDFNDAEDREDQLPRTPTNRTKTITKRTPPDSEMVAFSGGVEGLVSQEKRKENHVNSADKTFDSKDANGHGGQLPRTPTSCSKKATERTLEKDYDMVGDEENVVSQGKRREKHAESMVKSVDLEVVEGNGDQLPRTPTSQRKNDTKIIPSKGYKTVDLPRSEENILEKGKEKHVKSMNTTFDSKDVGGQEDQLPRTPSQSKNARKRTLETDYSIVGDEENALSQGKRREKLAKSVDLEDAANDGDHLPRTHTNQRKNAVKRTPAKDYKTVVIDSGEEEDMDKQEKRKEKHIESMVKSKFKDAGDHVLHRESNKTMERERHFDSKTENVTDGAQTLNQPENLIKSDRENAPGDQEGEKEENRPTEDFSESCDEATAPNDIAGDREEIPVSRVLHEEEAQVVLGSPEVESTENNRQSLQQQHHSTQDLQDLKIKAESLKKKIAGYESQRGLLEEQYRIVIGDLRGMEKETRALSAAAGTVLTDSVNQPSSTLSYTQRELLLARKDPGAAERIASWREQLEEELEEIKAEDQSMNNTILEAKKTDSEGSCLSPDQETQRAERTVEVLKAELKHLKKRSGIRKRLQMLHRRIKLRREKKRRWREWFS